MKISGLGFVSWLLIGTSALSACGKHVQVQTPDSEMVPGQTEIGVASWYGRPYHGRRAANGEIYDMETFTAAHRTLPFGSRVRVENLENGKAIELRINDRGPFVKDRIIDVSHAAARALDMVGPGTAQVRLQLLSIPADAAGSDFAIQVGAFQDRSRADVLCQDMENRYGSAQIVKREGDPDLWRVLVGRVGSISEAASLARRIRTDQPDKVGAAFVVHIDRSE